MTGRYNIRYGFASGVLKPAKPYGLPTNETILPQYLNALGFESHMVRDRLRSLSVSLSLCLSLSLSCVRVCAPVPVWHSISD
jgi:hypothetical protein